MAKVQAMQPWTTKNRRVAAWLRYVVQTEEGSASLLLRLSLGLVMLPHGAQHLLGWFGGFGFTATHEWMTETLGFPSALAALAIVTEFVAPIALILGLGGRIAALGIAGLMVGAASTHLEYGFFMNWAGALPAGAEGYEYHVLAITMAFAIVILGSGRWSMDRAIAKRVGEPGVAKRDVERSWSPGREGERGR